MSSSNLTSLIAGIKAPVDDPHFLQRSFTLVAKGRKAMLSKEADNIKRVCSEEYDDLSRRLDRTRIQESTSVRNVLRTRRLANLLIDDKGELNLGLLPKAIADLKQHLYSLGPDRQYDAKRQEHILSVLTTLHSNKEMQILLKNISKPYSHRYAEQIIKHTLQLPANTVIADPQARRAALSAWMCYLRQNVGSCFATAPSILIHDEQTDLMFKDLVALLGTGRLSRTYGGVEYSVPLSTSWGAGDLRRLFLLPRGELAESSDIWLSPGILAGLEAAGIFGGELPIKEKAEAAKLAVLKMLREWPEDVPYVLISSEEILRRVVLRSLELTAQDIQDYENRPKAMFAGSLLMQAPTSGVGGKAQACLSYYEKFEQAMDAFKALADNALLKSWEFTLASFSETKSEFTSWNLYSSLGLGPQEPGGIGQCLYQILKEKLDRANQKVQDFQIEYEQAFHHLKYIEARIRSANTEKELQWLKMEYQTYRSEFDILEEMRDKYNAQAHRFANLFDDLINLYLGLFPKYFQEVYDADMHDVSAGPYDDSPAGFRLLYKHGRAHTAQWTRIKNHQEFVEALASFFVTSESEVRGAPGMEGLESDISEMITAMVSHIRTTEFIETAFYRMAKAHNAPAIKDPLGHLDKIEKKPWVYTSGGTMDTLVSCYWRREQKPTEVGRWVENPAELLVFLVDTLKQIPPKLTDDYQKNPKKSMLIHSPTHAFLLKPGASPFKEAWLNDEYTYTYVRDNMIAPAQRFIEKITLADPMSRFLIGKLWEKVPPDFQFYFRQVFDQVPIHMNPIEFRNHIVRVMSKERGLGYGKSHVLPADEIDGTLFSLLPLFPADELKERIDRILALLPGIGQSVRHEIDQIWEAMPGFMAPGAVVSSKALQDIVKGLLCLALNATSTPVDYHWHISQAAKKLGYSMPMPVIFADTNWVKDEFAFVVSPGTGQLELWRVDYTGAAGYPMSSWDEWLNGSRKDRTWGVYTRPYEYTR